MSTLSALALPAELAAMQRTQGLCRFSVKARPSGRTSIARLHEYGAGKVRFPRQFAGQDRLEAILINTAGGVTGGDSLVWDVEAGPNTHLTVTTQANEKVYKASEGIAEVDIRLALADGSHLAWLPQETILFDNSVLRRKIEVVIAQTASLTLLEAVVFGRSGHGEQLRKGYFKDSWRISVGEKLVHAEEMLFDGSVADTLAHRAVANGAGAIATLMMVNSGGEGMAEEMRQVLTKLPDINGGVSLLNVGRTPGQPDSGVGKLIARVTAKDGYSLRKGLYPLVKLLNLGADLPKSWSL